MTFEATVYCNCFKEGKTKPFPLPELIEYFGVNSDMHPDLDIPWNSTTASAHNTIWEWIQSNPCQHEAMRYCSVSLGTNKGYWHFHRMLEKIGWEQFPTLHSALPKANGDYMSATDVTAGLAELDHFNQLTDLGTDVKLLVAESDDVIWENAGIWIMKFDKKGIGINVGIDKQGFFVRPSEGEKARDQFDIYAKALAVSRRNQFNNQPDALFRAWRFEQKILALQPELKVELHNLDTDQSFISKFAVELRSLSQGSHLGDTAQNWMKYPRNLLVREYIITPSDFSYIVEPLTKVFNASIETGNPVVWS